MHADEDAELEFFGSIREEPLEEKIRLDRQQIARARF
jgi:hypothetical protein